MTTTIGELCMGYGGLGMGLSRALGGDTRAAWAVEYDKHPSAIIAHRYPGVPNYGDVNDTDWAAIEPVDWLTAGYPCQPFSHAGLRKGADDPRHLWPGVARAVSVLRPRRVLLENVAGHVSLGLNTVLGDLAALGYDASWGVVRAADAGAPHGRARVFIVAADAGGQRHGCGQDARGLGRLDGPDADQAREWQRSRPEPGDRGATAAADAGRGPLAGAGAAGDGLRLAAERGAESAADAMRSGRQGLDGESCDVHATQPADDRTAVRWGAYAPAIARWERVLGRPAPRPTEAGRTAERLSPRFVEWMQGLPDGWVTDVPGLPRNAQLKALGNGVVPQQAALAVRLLTASETAVAA